MNLVWGLVITFSFGSAIAANKPYQKVLENQLKGCKLEKENIFLTKEQKSKLSNMTGQEIGSSLHLRYKANCSGKSQFAYIDSHIVRTLNETVVTILNAKGLVKSMVISNFMEPQEYKVPQKWVKYLAKNDEREVDALSGATLSSRALIQNKVRVQTLHKILQK